MADPTVGGTPPQVGRVARFNQALAIRITGAVGTMWMAYAFTILALLSLPAVLSGFQAFAGVFPSWLVKASIIALISWVAQTFLQLVLLSVIIVGQNIQSAKQQQTVAAVEATTDAVEEHRAATEAHSAALDAHTEHVAALHGKLDRLMAHHGVPS